MKTFFRMLMFIFVLLLSQAATTQNTHAASLDDIRKMAEQGSATAQYMLGRIYLEGPKGVPKDEKQAAEWFRKAAEQGNGDAQYHLGNMYLHGQGVAKDEKQAVEWFRKSAEQGNKGGQGLLGGVYLHGLGVAKDEKQAAEWFRKSAEQGLVGAQYQLGMMYASGTGVAKDEAQAMAWFRKAADQGYDDARAYLAKLQAAQELPREAEAKSKQVKSIADGFRGIPWGTRKEVAVQMFGLEAFMGHQGGYIRKDENHSLGNLKLAHVAYMFGEDVIGPADKSGFMGVFMGFDPRDYETAVAEVRKNNGSPSMASNTVHQWDVPGDVVIRIIRDGLNGNIMIMKQPPGAKKQSGGGF